jgi:hypothetical protein
MASNTDLYRSARDQLVDVIGDYDKAVETFSFPRLTGTFNWATDWFDVIARGPSTADRAALWIVEEDGSEQKISGKIRRIELRRREEEAHEAGAPIATEHRYEDVLSQ